MVLVIFLISFIVYIRTEPTTTSPLEYFNVFIMYGSVYILIAQLLGTI